MTDLRAKAEEIAADLMHHYSMFPYVLHEDDGIDKNHPRCFSLSRLSDRIHKHLLEIEEEKP